MRISSRESTAIAAPDTASAALPATASSAGATALAPGSFESVLRRLGRSIDRDERAIHAATSSWTGGDEWNAGELLSLQFGAYRYSEIVDVASRLVDRTASAVKTVLQGSGQ